MILWREVRICKESIHAERVEIFFTCKGTGYSPAINYNCYYKFTVFLFKIFILTQHTSIAKIGQIYCLPFLYNSHVIRWYLGKKNLLRGFQLTIDWFVSTRKRLIENICRIKIINSFDAVNISNIWILYSH